MSLRSDFEVASLFGAPFSGVGAFRKDKDGAYLNPTVEAAYWGYAKGRSHGNNQLDRLSPDRSIQIGHITEINARAKEAGIERPIDPALIRLVLATVKGWPV